MSLIESLGWFDDGWCEQVAALRVRCNNVLQSIKLEVWTKLGEGDNAVFKVRASTGQSAEHTVRAGDRVTLRLDDVQPVSGQIAIGIACDRRVTDTGDDERSLSFILSQVTFESSGPDGGKAILYPGAQPSR